MSVKFLNRVRMSVSGNPGTGTVVLNTQANGFQQFNSAGMVDGDQTPYLIEDGTPVGTIWELGIGTWHSNNTFVRDTVTQSSAGGTSKATFTSTAVISAIFRASDLTGIDELANLNDTNIVSPTNNQLLQFNGSNSKWENHAVSGAGLTAPSVVQYITAQLTSAPFTVTLPSAPTAGNLLVLVGNGAGTGNAFAGSAFDQIGELTMGGQYQCNYALRRVRSGDGATYAVGSVQAGGLPLLNVALVEISGVDISRFSLGGVSRQSVATSSPSYTAVNVVCNASELCLFFCAGDPQAISTTGPTMSVNNTQTVTGGGSTLVFGYDNAAGSYNGFSAAIAGAGGGAQAGAITLALSGF